MSAKSKAKVSETDTVIFPMKFTQNVQETILSEDVKRIPTNEANPHEDDTESRFSRLRKSVPKRSASIL